jgi:predicted PurR-regulated permease PerM
MPVQVDVLALIVTILLLLIAAFLIPLLIQVKNTAQRVDAFLNDAQKDLLPALRELRETSERLNQASAHAGTLFESLCETGESIHKINSFLHHDLGKYIGNAAGLWLGIRSASKVFVKQVKQQQGGD